MARSYQKSRTISRNVGVCMSVGNNIARITLETDYVCFQLFPFCFEILITNMVCISIHILSLTTRLTFTIDNTFFD
jgi:hypothetical protein